jgi:hypothetical protein
VLRFFLLLLLFFGRKIFLLRHGRQWRASNHNNGGEHGQR